MRLTLGAVKSSNIPAFVGMCGTDSKFLDLLNEAHHRLVLEGKYWGTYQTYAICLSSEGCLTWPRQVASIEAISINDQPITVRNQWFEYLQTGWGVRSICNSSELQLIDRGSAVTYEDPVTATTSLRVYSELAESAGSQLLVQGYDQNGQWIRTLDGTTWIDGELIDISTTKTTSTKYYTSVTGIQKPVTNGPVRLLKVENGIEIPIGYYEADETAPTYRRSIIPGLADTSNYNCCASGTLSNRKLVRSVVKLEHIDLVNDRDWLLIGNLPALKQACKAVKLEAGEDPEKANMYWGRAIDLLEKELGHYMGDGVVQPLRVEGDTWGAGSIQNVM